MTNSKPVFEGGLTFMGLPDILKIIGESRKTGMLCVTSGAIPKASFVYFIDGRPANAASDRRSGLDALHYLFGLSEGNFKFYEQEVRIERVITQSPIQIIIMELHKFGGKLPMIMLSLKESAFGSNRENEKPVVGA